MTENDIAKVVVDAAYRLHTELGPGLLESVYETLLARELEFRGLEVVRQQAISFEYRGVKVDEGFRADLIVNNLVIVEIKSVEQPHPSHRKQLKTYLKLAGKRLGLLIKDGIQRVVLGLPDS